MDGILVFRSTIFPQAEHMSSAYVTCQRIASLECSYVDVAGTCSTVRLEDVEYRNSKYRIIQETCSVWYVL